MYAQTNLVSDGSVAALHTDPNLINPWGISETPGADFWLSDNGTGLSTLYNGSGAVIPAVFTVPAPVGHAGPSTPTGVVYNGTGDFTVNGSPSSFIFSTEDGTISGWSGGGSSVTKVDHSADGAVYKGLAIGSVGANNFIYATNIHSGKIEVYDKNYAAVTPAGNFTDPGIAAGYAPFGIQNIGGNIFVTYALQDATKTGDVAGAGHGFVSEFSSSGTLIREISAHGTLNSPWGLAMAPADFGAFSGDLLVGNFGDGKIGAFNPTTGAFLGQISNSMGISIAIDGLWGLEFGSGGGAGNTNELFFTAGPGGEEHGLFGKLNAVATLSITTTTLSNWTQNQVGYSQTIATSNGAAPLTFSLASGQLPAGLTLNTSTGAITGEPTATGADTFTIKVLDHAGKSDTHAYTVTINPPPVITTATLLNWTLNQVGYSQTPVVTGGTGPFVFSKLSGTLPTGLTLNTTTGAITGKPTATGSFTFAEQVKDKSGVVASHSYTVTINPALSITTATFVSWTQNQPGYSQSPAAVGGTGPLTFSLASGAIPTGLLLNTSTGAITGKPTAAGGFTFTEKVTDKSGATATHPYSITINPPVAITTTSLSNWTYNQSGYSQIVATTGGTGPLHFNVTSGVLIHGLSLNPTTGAITGQPTTTATTSFTVQVTDHTGAFATRMYTMTVNGLPVITTTTLANGTLNQPNYSQTILVSGGTGPLVFSLVDSTLPTGLNLNSSTGVISGKPTVGGTVMFMLKVTDKAGAFATRSYSLKINSVQ